MAGEKFIKSVSVEKSWFSLSSAHRYDGYKSFSCRDFGKHICSKFRNFSSWRKEHSSARRCCEFKLLKLDLWIKFIWLRNLANSTGRAHLLKWIHQWDLRSSNRGLLSVETSSNQTKDSITTNSKTSSSFFYAWSICDCSWFPHDWS